MPQTPGARSSFGETDDPSAGRTKRVGTDLDCWSRRRGIALTGKGRATTRHHQHPSQDLHILSICQAEGSGSRGPETGPAAEGEARPNGRGDHAFAAGTRLSCSAPLVPDRRPALSWVWRAGRARPMARYPRFRACDGKRRLHITAAATLIT